MNCPVTGKYMHESAGAAKKHIASISASEKADRPLALLPYFYRHCSRWHVGHGRREAFPSSHQRKRARKGKKA